MPLRLAPPAAVVVMLCLPILAAEPPADQLRLLFDSPLPWLLPGGSLQWGGSAGLATGSPQPFHPGRGPVPERSVASLPLLLAGALGDGVEGSLRFGALATGRPDGTGGAVPSDVEIRVGFTARPQSGAVAPVAVWLTAKAPTGPDRGGASTDETDIGAGLSAGATWRRVDLFGHAGLELLGNPLRNGSQDDVASYGAGARLPARSWSFSAEVAGRAFSRFGNSTSRLRLGGGWHGGSRSGPALSAVVVVWHGLSRRTATWGVEAILAAARF